MNRWTSYKTSCFVTGCATSSFSKKTAAQGIYCLRLRYNPSAHETSNRQTMPLLLLPLLAPERRGGLYLTLVFFSSLICSSAGARLTIQNFKIPLIKVPNFPFIKPFSKRQTSTAGFPLWQPRDVRTQPARPCRCFRILWHSGPTTRRYSHRWEMRMRRTAG